MSEDQKLDLVAVNLEGKSLAWFQLLEKTEPALDWLSLSTAIQLQFGPSQFDNPREELLKLRQTSSVANYFEAFNDLAARAYGMDDALLLDCFVGGLHPELRREVKSRSPSSFVQAVALAKLFEERFLPFSSRTRSSQVPYIPPPSWTPTLKPNPITIVPTPSPSTQPLLTAPPKPTNLRKLTPAEIQFRCENNLCFTCDDKFSPSHRCASKHYFIIQSLEELPLDQEQITTADLPNPPIPEPEPEPGEMETHHLSYNAFTGIPTKRSIRFSGQVKGRQIRILMDGGSSDNFIHPHLASSLDLTIHRTPPFKVEVGSGELLHCEGEVTNIPIHIQGHTLCISAFVLPIASKELVLGDSRLETLETHLVNYKEKFITFLANDKLVTLQGEQNQGPLQAHFRQFKRLQSMSSITAMYTLQVQAADPPRHTTLLELPHNLASDVASILYSFPEVFQPPRGLPPARAHDHHISLMPNTAPVKVRPYRYPHSQNSEIAKIVSDMLQEGIIRPSTSPFSSP